MRKINFIIILLLSSICCFGQGASASSINRRATLFLNKRVGIKDYKIGKPDYTCIKMRQLYTILHNKIRVQPLLLLLWLQIY